MRGGSLVTEITNTGQIINRTKLALEWGPVVFARFAGSYLVEMLSGVLLSY